MFVVATLGLRAAEVTADGQISAVTVFGDRAEVTRSAKVELKPGSQQVRFKGIPEALFRDSLQLKTAGPLILQDIRLDTVYLDEVADATARKLHDEMELLLGQRREVSLATARIDKQAKALESIWSGLTSRGEGVAPVMDPAQWSVMLDFQSKRLAELDEKRLALEMRASELSRQISELQEKINQYQASGKRTRTDVIAVLESQSAGEFPLALTYQTRGARWAPNYQIRADSKDDTVQVSYRAEVVQNTGEDWSDVALSLSTAQPHIEGQAPELEPWWVSFYQPSVKRSRAYSIMMEEAPARPMEGQVEMNYAGVDSLSSADLAKFDRDSLSTAINRLPSISEGVTATTFQVPAKISVPASSDPVICTLLQFQSQAEFRHTAVPKLSSHVYLKAEIENETDGQLLPGPANIFIDGNYVGQAAFKLVAPGEEFWVDLGVDPAVTVERKQLEGEEGDVGMFSGDKRVVRNFEFVIKNNRRQPVELALWDQLPMTNSDDIEIELLMPKISSEGGKITMNDEKAIEWLLELRPGEERKMPFRYAVQYPKDKLVSGL